MLKKKLVTVMIYYEPKKSSGAFDDKYIAYKSTNGSKNTSIEQYLQKIRLYLGIMIDKLKKSGEQKIQLTINVNFMSSKDNNDKRIMHSKSDHLEIMTSNQLGLETSKKLVILLLIVLMEYIINVIK